MNHFNWQQGSSKELGEVEQKIVLSVCLCVCPSVRLSVCLSATCHTLSSVGHIRNNIYGM